MLCIYSWAAHSSQKLMSEVIQSSLQLQMQWLSLNSLTDKGNQGREAVQVTQEVTANNEWTSLWPWAVNPPEATLLISILCCLPPCEVWKAKDGGITSWDGQGWVGRAGKPKGAKRDTGAIEAGGEQVFTFPIPWSILEPHNTRVEF